MSHKETVIDLDPSLTVIRGANNTGKSALVLALRVLLYNERGDYMLRHGQDYVEVSITTDQHQITWKREKNDVTYVISGKEISRLKGNTLDQVHTLLQMPMISTQEDTFFDIHFSDQKKPIFLLDSPPSYAAMFFASTSDAEKVLEMQKKHRDKMRINNEKQKWIEHELKVCDARLDNLQGIDELERSLNLLEGKEEKLTLLSQRIEDIKRLINKLYEIEKIQKKEKTIQSTLRLLKSFPKLNNTESINKTIVNLQEVRLELNFKKNQNRTLSLLKNLPTLAETKPIERLLYALIEHTQSNSLLNEQKNSIEKQSIDIHNQFRLWTKEHPKCPLCGSKVANYG